MPASNLDPEPDPRDSPDTVAIFISPGGFENYLEEISHHSPVTGLIKILEISKRYGIKFQL